VYKFLGHFALNGQKENGMNRYLMLIGIAGAAVLIRLVATGAVDAPRAQATVAPAPAIEVDARNPHQGLDHDTNPDEESWIVIDQVYQVWLNHNAGVTEQVQLNGVLLKLATQKYKVKSMTVTSYDTRLIRSHVEGQVPNTVLIFVEK